MNKKIKIWGFVCRLISISMLVGMIHGIAIAEDHSKYFLTEGIVVNVEYIAKPSTFGSDIRETILRFDDGRVYVIHNVLANIVLNKRIRIYQHNYSVWYKE